MNRVARACAWIAIVFGLMAFLWWEAQRSSWWSWALFTTIGLIAGQAHDDIKAAARRWRRKRKNGEAAA